MKKSVFIDTNVLVDFLDQRQPFYEASVSIMAMSEKAEFQGYVSAISYNNIYYLLCRTFNHSIARKKLVVLRDIVRVVALDQQIINQAIDSKFGDFEDAIQYFSALHTHADCIITRNKKHFTHSDIPVLEPVEFLRIA
jgi:predicted nucleic acid-binding protein